MTLPVAFALTQAAAIAAPGDLVSAKPIAAPPHAKAWRVVYQTTGLDGAPREVSGLIVVPETKAPRGGRFVVTWAHPTTGIAEACAPSLSRNRYSFVPALPEMIARGYVVVATDYPGLGTPGPHPYLVGVSEARSVIDIVRAARKLAAAQASNRYIAWGHSQGGQAVLFVNQIAASYAPELRLLGVVAAAPPTQLEQNLRDVIATTPGRLLAAYTLASWSYVYDTPMSAVTAPGAKAIVHLVARQCALTRLTQAAVMFTAKLLPANMLLPSFWTSPAWVDAARRNSPDPNFVGAPMLVAQGTNDLVVPPSFTAAFVQKACDAGEKVDLYRLEGGTHFWAAMDSVPVALGWVAQHFASAASPGGCTTSDMAAPAHPRP